MKKTTSNTFGGRLKILRATTAISQEELGQKLFMTRSCIANYEADNRRPSIETIKKLSDYFKVSPSYLMGESNMSFDLEISDTNCHDFLKYLTKDGKLDISELTSLHKIALIEYFLFLKDKNKTK